MNVQKKKYGPEERRHHWDLEKERHWRGVVAEHKVSGSSIRGFCSAKGINESLFYAWRRTISNRDRVKREAPIAEQNSGGSRPFVPISIVTRQASKQIQQSIEIILAGKAQIVVHHDTNLVLVAKLLRALEMERC